MRRSALNFTLGANGEQERASEPVRASELAAIAEAGPAMFPVFSSKSQSVVNQSCGENSKWGIDWLRRRSEFEGFSPETTALN